jgi:RNA-binding protein 5/10
MTAQIHPAGFRISDVPVAASFAHPDSFIMVDAMHRDEACLVSSHALGGSEHGWCRYWDETSTVAVVEFEVVIPTQTASNKEKEKKKKKGGIFFSFCQFLTSSLPQ